MTNWLEIQVNRKHQFEEEMRQKSSEFTGTLYTKSESRTEDVIDMMNDVQDKFTHKFTDELGNTGCFEKLVLSGDNKTEKNSVYGILRYQSRLIN